MARELTLECIVVSSCDLDTLDTEHGHQAAINVEDNFYLLKDVAYGENPVSGKTVAELL